MRTTVRSLRIGLQHRRSSLSLRKHRAGEAAPSRIQSAVDGARWACELPAEPGPEQPKGLLAETGNPFCPIGRKDPGDFGIAFRGKYRADVARVESAA